MKESTEQPMKVGDWLVTILLTAIPLVGIIMLFIWGFGGNAPTTKSNFAKAMLIWYAIGIVLTFVFYGAIAALFIASGGMDGGGF